MVEYPVDEALELLQNNVAEAKRLAPSLTWLPFITYTLDSILQELSQDLNYLKEQIIVTQVSMARVYNFDVKQRRQGTAVQ